VSGAVLVTSFGSIGRRHVKNLLDIGITPFVLTEYPDPKAEAIFISRLENLSKDVKYAIVCSPTYRHLDDIVRLSALGIKNFLVEKPIEKDLKRAEEILSLAHKEKLDIHIAYNMRYLLCFNVIKKFAEANRLAIRIVEICKGEYLADWRPHKDYRKSYSVHRAEGGGVDLDLSHEIDYMLWLFGEPLGQEILKAKVSDLKMDSDDIFVGTYKYSSFVVVVKLDCIRRKKERYLRIICENGNTLYCDFENRAIAQTESFGDSEEIVNEENLFDMHKTYIDEVKVFLGLAGSRERLSATLEDSIRVLKAIK